MTSPAWVVAFVAAAALVALLTYVTLRLLRAQADLATSVAAQSGRLGRLETELRSGERSPGAVSAPSSVLLLLEPAVPEHRQLAADIRAAGAVSVGVPTRLRVADSDAGRALVDGFPVDVEFERRTRPMSGDVPSVLVLDRQGKVVAGGVASSVVAVRELVDSARR